MPPSLMLGLVLTLCAGMMAGNCMLPLKFFRNWQWENAWLVFSIISLVVLPWGLALSFVSHLPAVYHRLTFWQLAAPMLFGAGWGVAQILFGVSVKRLGLGLAYAIIIGLGALLGTLVPLLTQQRAQVSSAMLIHIITGVLLMLGGIALCTWGGQVREQEAHLSVPSIPKNGYAAAVLLAVLCGVMAPMLNYSFAFGQDIALQAIHLGNPAVRAAYAVWPIGLAGGFIPNIAYSLYLLRKNHTWSYFQPIKPDIFWSALMGVLWMGAMALYGMSATFLGSFGTSIGWGLFQIFMIMTAVLSGVLTGEWRKSTLSAKSIVAAGIVCLTGATVLLATGNR